MRVPEILIVEDEVKIRQILRAYLVNAGFSVDEAGNGKTGLQMALQKPYDLVVLDLMLPELSGEEVARQLRAASEIPILMLTAKGDESERLNGFALGADDYVAKPFSAPEVVARIRAILKRLDRGLPEDMPVINFHGLVVEPLSHRAKLHGEVLKLTATEFELLYELAAHPDRVFSRTQLASRVLGYNYESYDRTIDTHIKNLRKKLGETGKLIETVFGVGYKFNGSQESLQSPDS